MVTKSRNLLNLHDVVGYHVFRDGHHRLDLDWLVRIVEFMLVFLHKSVDPADPRVNRLIADVANQTVNTVVRSGGQPCGEAGRRARPRDGGADRGAAAKGLGGDREDAERCGRGTRCVGEPRPWVRPSSPGDSQALPLVAGVRRKSRLVTAGHLRMLPRLRGD